MNVYGFQKLTLLDYPGHLGCTVFTGGCNFRCPFCHNASLVLHPDQIASIPDQEVLSYLSKRRSILEGVCISGGEPTIQKDLIEFIRSIKELGFLVKLDTNGSHPEILKKLCDEHLIDYVAMDIKNSKEHYAKTIGLEHYDLSAIEASADYLLHGTIDYEFRTTVVSELHTIQDFDSIGTWLAGAKQFYLQGFVDSGDLIKDHLSAYSKDDMTAFLQVLQRSIPNAAIRGIE